MRASLTGPLLLAVALLGQGCAASRALAPLDKGQHGITSSLGGPFVQFAGAPIPLPISSIGYQYGIDGKTNVHTSLLLTQLALFKVGGLDVGVARELMTADGARPRLMLDVTTTWFLGDRTAGEPEGGFRFFPEVSLVATWDLGKRPHRLYLGVDTFFQVFPEGRVYPTPILGTELRATKTFAVQLEVGWLAPWKDTVPLNPVWYGPGNLGAVSFKLGFNGYLPTTRKKRSAPVVEEAP